MFKKKVFLVNEEVYIKKGENNWEFFISHSHIFKKENNAREFIRKNSKHVNSDGDFGISFTGNSFKTINKLYEKSFED